MTHANISPCHSEGEVQEGQFCLFLLQFLRFFALLAFCSSFCGFLAFLAFCLVEIFGSQGAKASTGLYYGALEWEIALKLPIVIVPPPSQLPLLRFTFRLKAKMRSRLRCQKILRAIVYRGTGRESNYESNQPWNAPISCFRPCLMLEINYSHASDIIIITINIIIVTIIPVIQYMFASSPVWISITTGYVSLSYQNHNATNSLSNNDNNKN